MFSLNPYIQIHSHAWKYPLASGSSFHSTHPINSQTQPNYLKIISTFSLILLHLSISSEHFLEQFPIFTRWYSLFKILTTLLQWILSVWRESAVTSSVVPLGLTCYSHVLLHHNYEFSGLSPSLDCELLQEFDVALSSKCLISGKYLALKSIYSMSTYFSYENHLSTILAASSKVYFNKYLWNIDICKACGGYKQVWTTHSPALKEVPECHRHIPS